MLSAVLDSTILVSSFLTEGGVAFKILQSAREEKFQWYCTEVILQETRRVLLQEQRLRTKYHYTDEQVEVFINASRASSLMVAELPTVKIIARDPQDDPVVACALAAQATYIVTRDKDLLDLQSYQGITILTPEEFLRILQDDQQSASHSQ